MSTTKILKASFLAVIPATAVGLYLMTNARTEQWAGVSLALVGTGLGWVLVARCWLWLRGEDA